MPSFQIVVSPTRRAAARFINHVRRELVATLMNERANGLNQSSLAEKIGVHRSVISRELNGRADIGVGRIGELAEAMGYEPYFELRKPASVDGTNVSATTSSASGTVDIQIDTKLTATSLSGVRA